MTRSRDPDVRRRRLLQMLGATGAMGLAGCISMGGDDSGGGSGGTTTGDSASGGGTGSDAGTASGGQSSMEMAQSASGWGWNIAGESLKNAAGTYNEQNDGEISIEVMGGDSWEQRFQTAVTSGSGAPDFSAVQNYDVTAFADIDGLTDLTERINGADIEDDIVDGKWTTVTLDDSYYAIPWDIGPTGVFYKRDRYEQAGINPDDITTWDAFIEAGKQLPDDVAMINLPTSDMSSLWRMLFRQLGGQPFTEDGAIKMHSQNSVRVAQLIKDMQDAGITTRIETWSGGWFTSFAEGTLASVATAAWMDGTLRAELPDTAGNWGVYRLPAFEEGGTRASNRGGSNLAIPSQIEDEEVVNRAWDYCLWAMTTPDVQNRMLEEYGLFPSLTTAYEGDIYDRELDFYDGQAVFGLFADVATEIEPYRYTVDTPEVQNAIQSELGRMLDGEKSPETAVQDAAETVASRTDRDLADLG